MAAVESVEFFCFVQYCTFNPLTAGLYRWVMVEMPCSLFLKLQAFRGKKSYSKFGHRGRKKICVVADIIAFI
jgi:hypothetical protein